MEGTVFGRWNWLAIVVCVSFWVPLRTMMTFGARRARQVFQQFSNWNH